MIVAGPDKEKYAAVPFVRKRGKWKKNVGVIVGKVFIG